MRVNTGPCLITNIKVVVVEMAKDDEIHAIDKAIEYGGDEDIIVYVTHAPGLAWLITWLAIPNHRLQTIDSGVLTTGAALRLLDSCTAAAAERGDAVPAHVWSAKVLIEEYLKRRQENAQG